MKRLLLPIALLIVAWTACLMPPTLAARLDADTRIRVQGPTPAYYDDVMRLDARTVICAVIYGLVLGAAYVLMNWAVLGHHAKKTRLKISLLLFGAVAWGRFCLFLSYDGNPIGAFITANVSIIVLLSALGFTLSVARLCSGKVWTAALVQVESDKYFHLGKLRVHSGVIAPICFSLIIGASTLMILLAAIVVGERVLTIVPEGLRLILAVALGSLPYILFLRFSNLSQLVGTFAIVPVYLAIRSMFLFIMGVGSSEIVSYSSGSFFRFYSEAILVTAAAIVLYAYFVCLRRSGIVLRGAEPGRDGETLDVQRDNVHQELDVRVNPLSGLVGWSVAVAGLAALPFFVGRYDLYTLAGSNPRHCFVQARFERYFNDTPGSLKNSFDLDKDGNIEFIGISNLEGLDPDVLARLGRALPSAPRVTIFDESFDDSLLPFLTSLRGIEELRINRSSLSDPAELRLATPETLKEFHTETATLSGSQFVVGYPNLESLILLGNAVDDEVLAGWEPQNSLTYLFLDRTTITDKTIPLIAQHSALVKLDLHTIRPFGSALGDLSRLQSLKELDVQNTLLRDEHVLVLSDFPSLEKLNIWNTLVTQEGYERLRDQSNGRFEIEAGWFHEPE